MAHITVHYLGKSREARTVTVDAFRKDEVFWIGARKAGMSRADFVRSIIQLDEEKLKKIK